MFQQISILEWFLKDDEKAEDWSNDAENWALHHKNKLHFKIYSNKKIEVIKIFTVLFYCILIK